MGELVSYPVPRVTEEEAIDLMIYHMRMAVALFDATPTDVHRLLTALMNKEVDELDRDALIKLVVTLDNNNRVEK